MYLSLNLDNEKFILCLLPFRLFLGGISEDMSPTEISDSHIKAHFKSLLNEMKTIKCLT